MGLNDITAKRALLSYAKVQRLISRLIRNKPLFFSRNAREAKLLNIGCGLFPLDGFVNLDWHWCPGVDVCWDLRKPYPFADGRFEGIFCEHCIDGLPPAYFLPNLREMYRVLKPGGTLRISFCDSELYVDAYTAWRAKGEPTPFMEERGHRTGMEALDWIYHHATHRTLVDFETLEIHLREAGFTEVRRCGFQEGRDPLLLQDQDDRHLESLYVEAVKSSTELRVPPMTVDVARRLVRHARVPRGLQIGAGLIGEAEQHEEYIRELLAEVLRSIALFLALLTVTPRHDPGHLADLLGEHGHVGELVEVAHTDALDPAVHFGLEPLDPVAVHTTKVA